MRDETVGTGDAPSNDFDLDSFLRENDFLTKDDEGQQQADPRSVREQRRTGFGLLPSKSPKNPPNNLILSPEDVNVQADLNKTMSYAALGEDYPEIPLIEDERLERQAAAETAQTQDASDAQESSQAKQAIAKTEPAKQQSTKQVKEPTENPVDKDGVFGATADKNPAAKVKSDPKPQQRSNKTADTAGTNGAGAAAGTNGAANAANAVGTAGAAGAVGTAGTAGAANAANTAGATGATGTTGAAAKNKTAAAKPKKGRAATAATAAAAATSTTQTASTRKQSRSQAAAKSKAAAQKSPRLATLANPDDFHFAELTDNTYRIRGGGTRHNRRSPIMVILIAVVVIAAIGVLAFFAREIYNNFMVPKEQEVVITLTPEEARSAIDAELPAIIDYLWYDADEAYDYFIEAGWNVFLNDRATSDNPDFTSYGNEIIRLNPQVSEDILNGYYESEFNAYDFNELQQSFNGAWMFDISHGDKGEYGQIKYINLASGGLTAELEHFRALQGLTGENSLVVTQDVDDFGNTFIQGYTVIDETTYYWKLIGITFKEYYRGQDRRPLPNTAVYVKCTVATFDFYGADKTADEISASLGLGQDSEEVSDEGSDTPSSEESADAEDTSEEE